MECKLTMNDNNIYYTYIYMDPRKKGPFTYNELTFDYQPFYVGKGKCGRWKEHLRETFKLLSSDYTHKHNKIKKILSSGLYPIILKSKFIDEKKALVFENILITTIGRQDLSTGPLVNFTDGGVEQSNISPYTRLKLSINNAMHDPVKRKKSSDSHKGYKRSFESRNKQSISIRGSKHWAFGRKFPEEVVDKFRKAKLGKTWDVRFGKDKSQELKNKLSKSIKGTRHTQKTKLKISLKNSGENNGMYGKTHSVESRDKMVSNNGKIYVIINPDNTKSYIKNLSKYCRDNDKNLRHFQYILKTSKRDNEGYMVKICNDLV